MSELVAVVVFSRFFEPGFRGGGPIQTLVALLHGAPSNVRATLICGNHDLGDPSPLVDHPDTWVTRNGVRVRYTSGGASALVQSIRSSERATRPSVVYLNSFFDVRFGLVPRLCHALGVWRGSQLVLAPRGELEPGALALKRIKKRLFIVAYRLLSLHRNVLWHASTDHEAASIRAVFGSRADVAIRENETSLPKSAQRRAPRAEGPARIVFASRAVPKKGLLVLLQAMSSMRHRVELEIIGEFEDPRYREVCLAAVDRLPANVTVSLVGALDRDLLLERLHRSDLMALPTLGENFGHVIAEALSGSCPVMCSDTTPWSPVLRAGAGVVVASNEPSAWADSLNRFVAAGPENWPIYSQRAARGYNAWRSEDKGDHIFSLALSHMRSSSKTGE